MDTQNNQQGGGQNTPPAPEQKSVPLLDPGKNLAMAVLAYIGPLVIVSYIVAKSDAFVKYHIKQGLVLFVISVGVWFVGMLIPPLYMILWLVNIAVFVLAIIGIINAVKGVEKELPIVGKYSKHFPI